MDLTTLTIKELSEKLLKKETSSVEATKAYLKRIEEIEGNVHAFVTVTPDEALAALGSSVLGVLSPKQI